MRFIGTFMDYIFGGQLGYQNLNSVLAIVNLFVDEIGDHLTDENGNRLGEY